MDFKNETRKDREEIIYHHFRMFFHLISLNVLDEKKTVIHTNTSNYMHTTTFGKCAFYCVFNFFF